MPTLIISGFPRSGTTMMMDALGAGGAELVYSGIRDATMNEAMAGDGYRPNPDGLREIPMPVQNHPGFPRQYFGKALKVLLEPFGAATKLWCEPGHRYFIIVMRRDFEEVRQSFEAFFAPRGSQWPLKSREIHEGVFASGVELLTARTDANVVVWDYDAVLADPLAHLSQVPGIKFDSAAAIVDRGRKRFDKSKLVVGA